MVYVLNYLQPARYFRGRTLKKLRVCKIDSPNVDIRFILENPYASGHSQPLLDLDAAVIKKISKKQASKPLIIFREEQNSRGIGGST